MEVTLNGFEIELSTPFWRGRGSTMVPVEEFLPESGGDVQTASWDSSSCPAASCTVGPRTAPGAHGGMV